VVERPGTLLGLLVEVLTGLAAGQETFSAR
jgi:hypothetical protein